MNSFKRFILWDYRRGSIQYDIMVGLILAFIFLTPREWFKDQPKASSVTMLQTAHGGDAFWIDSAVLSGNTEAEKLAQASQILKNRTGRKENVIRLEAIVDSEQEIKGYMAFTNP
jgi:hypothetical protein